jgi:hypothetical protein
MVVVIGGQRPGYGNAGSLDRRVTLQRVSYTSSPSGEPEESWTSLATNRAASVLPVHGSDAWSIRVDGARLLANAVQDLLSGYRGTVASVPVQGAFLVGGREDWDGEAQMFRVSRDYNVHYQDA